MYGQGDDPATAANEVNLFGSAAGGSKPTGWGLDAEYSFMPEKLHLLATVGEHDNGGPGSAKRSAGLGLYWKVAQNIDLQPMYEVFSGDQGKDANGDNITRATVTLEADF